MKYLALLPACLLSLCLATSLKAEIIGYSCAPDGDGAITCTHTWDEPIPEEYELTINGDHHAYPVGGHIAHINGTFTTDTELDPTVSIRNAIENDTGFDWLAYQVNISMNKTFQLSNALAYAPSGWTATITQQPPAVGTAPFLGQITLSGATPLAPTELADFSYKMSFIGSVSYAQEFVPVPVPEPTTLALVGVAAAACLLLRRRAG